MTTANFQHRPRRNWLQINITCDPDKAELLIPQLTALTQSGIQTETVSGQELIISYLEKDDLYAANRQALDQLLSSFSDHLTVKMSTLEEENWAENWKDNYKPARLSKHITVKPTWEDYETKTDEIVIEIDPGMAFGTGLHFSTRLALCHIDTLFHQDPRPATVLDVGTGTGILALACAKLGAEQIIAIDNDPDAVATAINNIKQNHEQRKIDCSTAEIHNIPGQMNLVTANITADILTLLQPEITLKIKPGGHLILAGILTGHQASAITDLYQANGLQLLDQNQEDEWTGLLFRQNP